MLAPTHHVCAESFKVVDNQFSAAGGHRVRKFALKKNVHWMIPGTVLDLDIQNVPPASAPRRQPLR